MKTRLVVLAVAALVAWGLKRHYASARVEDLGWIVAPTARLAGVATGTTFALQPGEGYVSRDRLFLIEKSCAGVNFLVAAFGMLVLARIGRVWSLRSAAQVLGASLLAGYGAAVLANAVRIAAAVWLTAHPLASLTAADAHRVEGVAVYFVGLVLLHEAARRFDGRMQAAGGAS